MKIRDYSSKDFSFEIPERLIAQSPPEVRGTCRLLRLDRSDGELSDHSMDDIDRLLPTGSLLVFNDSRVRKARLLAETEAGGSVELLLIEPVGTSGEGVASSAIPRREGGNPNSIVDTDEDASNADYTKVRANGVPGEKRWRVLVSKAKRQKPGRRLVLPGGNEAEVIGDDGPYKLLEFSLVPDDAYLERWGHVPLPPYIKRSDTRSDADRYQTVYAREVGSAAAPTAGLHFTPELIARLETEGFGIAYITLHVGIGTFLPIRTASIAAHKMHTERYSIDETATHLISRARDENRPVVAVGTTVVRTLEAAARRSPDGAVSAGEGSTDLFITPGFEFQVVDAMFTNFHTPESSLIVMVSAFAGIEPIRSAYRHAIENEYRFFSYGDAMLIV